MAPFAILIRTDGSDFQAESSERMRGRRKEVNAERIMPWRVQCWGEFNAVEKAEVTEAMLEGPGLEEA
jgi:hypothetical protein